MGGSSIWFTCVAIGIILSVSRFVEEEKKTMAENVVTANLTSNNEIE
jgi:hypothetical protein